MKLNFDQIIIISLICLLTVSGLAKAEKLEINERMTELQADFYSGLVDTENLNNQVKELETVINQSITDPEKYYWLAQTQFWQSKISRRNGNEKKAEKGFEKSKKLAYKALKKEVHPSDSRRLVADNQARLIEYKGAFYAIRNGSEILDLLEKAVSLDEKNYAAYNSLGIALLQAPKIGGGSIEKAIENLKGGLNSSQQPERFRSYYFLTKCYQEQGKLKQAKSYLEQSQQIYPDNPQVKSLKEQLDTKAD
jgi:tetratricopeptide (TPR) repeat protein